MNVLVEVMRFRCRFSYPAIHRELKKITGEEDWMGFMEMGEDPVRMFRTFVKEGLLEKDDDEVVVYMDVPD